MTKPERRKAVRTRAHKPKAEEPVEGTCNNSPPSAGKQPVNREVISANHDTVVWLETWDLHHPGCPFAPSGRDHDVYIVQKFMPREQFEMMFGEVHDQRVH